MSCRPLVIPVLLLCLALGSCRNTASYPISAPMRENVDLHFVGWWKFEEDTNKANFYEVLYRDPYPDNAMHVKFWNRGGTNPTYEANMHLSEINGTRFINVPYFEDGFTNTGFLFLRILDTAKQGTRVTAAVVGDTTMRSLKSSTAVRDFITLHMNNPSFYSDTIHMFRLPK